MEWNNGKGYQRGLLVPDKQVKQLTKQGRALVYMLDENFDLVKNEKGGNVIGIIPNIKEAKVIGFQD